jgi:hypothetical protein
MWTFEIITGKMYRPNGSLLATGYAGGWGGISADKNNPAAENIPDEGPLPEGMWTIGPSFYNVEMGCAVVMRLTPDPDVNLKGRDAFSGGLEHFMIHGDSLENPGCASKGCIIMPRTARNEISASIDRRLSVVAHV